MHIFSFFHAKHTGPITDFNVKWPFKVIYFEASEKPVRDFILPHNVGHMSEDSEDSDRNDQKLPLSTTLLLLMRRVTRKNLHKPYLVLPETKVADLHFCC